MTENSVRRDIWSFFSTGSTGEQDSLVYRPHSARPPTSVRVRVSPNPTSYYAKFLVSVAKGSVGQALKLSIYSLGGQLLEAMEFRAHPGDNELYWLIEQPVGMYLYKIQVDNQVNHGRVVVN